MPLRAFGLREGGLVMRLVRFVWLVALMAGCAAPYALRHTVRPGETAGSLAASVGATEGELRELNRLGSADRLRPGDTVFLPAPRPGVRAEPPPAGAPDRPVPVAPRPAPPEPPREVARLDPPRQTAPLDPPREIARVSPPKPVVLPPPAPAARPRTPPASPPPGREADAGRAGPLRWPVSGEVLRGFGRSPAGENRGIDVAAAVGTKARAAAAGRVLYAGTPVQAYGPMVILEHAGGLHTVYANLREALVTKGAQVTAGEVIGATGETRRDLPPHLHFEVRRKGEPVDPLLALPPP